MNCIFCKLCILFEPGSKFHLIEKTSAIFIPWDEFHSVVKHKFRMHLYFFYFIIFNILNCFYYNYIFKFISIIVLSLECWRIFLLEFNH